MKEDIEKLYSEWLSLQPLKKEDYTRLYQKFMLEFNYNSNHIEGNTLTYGQTELLLMFGKVVDEANMKDLEEMKAHNVGLKMIIEEAKNKEKPLTEIFIRILHQTILRDDYIVHKEQPNGFQISYTIHAGRYKTRPNSVKTVTGELFEYASPEETPALMADLIEWYNEEEKKRVLSPIELAAVFHYRYIRIHPFEDGNGRIARLLVNYILLKQNYPMVIVQSKEKDHYLSALNKCDISIGSTPSIGAYASIAALTPFIQYLENCMLQSLNICIKAAKGENIEDEDDFEKRIIILERQQKHPIEFNMDEFYRLKNFFDSLSITVNEKIVSLHRFFHDIDTKVFVHSEDSVSALPFPGLSLMSLCVNPNKNLITKEAKLTMDVKVIFDSKTYHIPILGKDFLYGTNPSTRDVNRIISIIRESLIEQLEETLKN